mgnify:CR=1 FL=1
MRQSIWRRKTVILDILYLDIDMPQMSGMELARKKFRGDRSRRHPHFLHEFAAIRAERVQCRALGFIVKPIQWVLLPYVSDAGAEGAAKSAPVKRRRRRTLSSRTAP